MQFGNNGYAVIYDANGGEGAPKEQVKQEGKNLVLSTTVPTKAGYTFMGWSEYADNESYKFAKGATYSEDRGIKLYATWVQKTESEIISTITGESLISIVQNNNLKNGFYNFVVNDETYKVNVFVKNGDYTFGGNGETPIFGDNIANNSMTILKCNGNLTISSGETLTPYTTPKGMFIYASGTITNNGTISMSQKGSTATSQNVYLWKNKVYDDESKKYELVPIAGAEGGLGVHYASTSNAGKSGKTGNIAENRATGGGGSGAVATRQGDSFTSTKGGTGTSYEGGNGTGSKDYMGNSAGNKTPGGLLIINANKVDNTNGFIEANGARGSKGSSAYASGGGSGGGSVNIFCEIFDGDFSTVTANGGAKNTAKYSGGAGGMGSVSIGSISTGTYVELEQ